MIGTLLLLLSLSVTSGLANDIIHPLSFAKLQINCSETEVRFELRIQDLTLADTLDWELDTNFDNSVTRKETEAVLDEFLDYLATDLWFEINGEIWRPSPSFMAYETAAGHNAPDQEFYTHLAVTDAIPLDGPLQDLKVHSDLFYARGNPLHRMHVAVLGLSESSEPLQYLMSAKARDADFLSQINSAPPGLREGEKAFYLALEDLPLIALTAAAIFCAESFGFGVLSLLLLLGGLALGSVLSAIGDSLSLTSANLSLAFLSISAAAGIRMETSANTASRMSWHGLLFLSATFLGNIVGMRSAYLFETTIAFSAALTCWFLGIALLLWLFKMMSHVDRLGKASASSHLLLASIIVWLGLNGFGCYGQTLLKLPFSDELSLLALATVAAVILISLPGHSPRHDFGRKAVRYGLSLLLAFALGQSLGAL